ncbi:hypothetical protein OG730_39720 [Streptomyces sp. NBC_01298]|nr:hypothetical protein OG730_39720 [Streptomyces sp. NBC_01298]
MAPPRCFGSRLPPGARLIPAVAVCAVVGRSGQAFNPYARSAAHVGEVEEWMRGRLDD